jgi:hypothetical protein
VKNCNRGPSLTLDINLGDKVCKLDLYPEDGNRLVEVTEEFAERYGVDEENKKKLYEMVKM